MRVLKTDPRAHSNQTLIAPAPLPFISRRQLAKVVNRINPPKHCDCCGAKTVKLVDNIEIYGRPYGDWHFAYLCGQCGAYVGLHPGTDLPLGTMADKATRKARQQKRQFLDLIASKFGGDRDAGYAWLAEQMGTDPKECHWGLFTLEQCEQAAQIVKEAEQ